MAIEILADISAMQSEDPEYQQLRKLGLGGSDAGAVCGLSRFRTPYQVWSEKVNPSATAHRESEAMHWGKLLEDPIREEFTERTGIEVHPLPKMIRNTDQPFMLASVDGVTGPSTKLSGVYEGKTTRFADHWPKDEDGTVQVPLEYVVQGMHYLAVLGLERVHFACLIGGQELRIAEVEANPTLIADLIEIEEAFWRKVIEREPPPAEAGDVPTLKKMWTPTAGTSVELPASFIPALKVRAQRKTQIKQLEADVDKIDAEIMALMGEAEEATVLNKGVVATWKSSTRNTPDWEMIAKATSLGNPDLAKSTFSKQTVSRRFLPKEIDQ